MKNARQLNPKTFEALRNLPSMLQRFPEPQFLPSASFPGEIQCGALTEISGRLGTGKTDLMLRVLGESQLTAAWIEAERNIYPAMLAQYGIAFSHLLFVEAGAAIFWAALEVLRSKLFEVVILTASTGAPPKMIELKRLQLAAEKAAASVVLLTETPLREAWCVAKRFEAPFSAQKSPQKLNV